MWPFETDMQVHCHAEGTTMKVVISISLFLIIQNTEFDAISPNFWILQRKYETISIFLPFSINARSLHFFKEPLYRSCIFQSPITSFATATAVIFIFCTITFYTLSIRYQSINCPLIIRERITTISSFPKTKTETQTFFSTKFRVIENVL